LPVGPLGWNMPLMDTGGRSRGAQVLIDELTAREREILWLIAQGRSNTAISEELVLSGKTVETHIRNLYAKLELAAGEGCHRRVRAALLQLEASASTSPMAVAAPSRATRLAVAAA